MDIAYLHVSMNAHRKVVCLWEEMCLAVKALVEWRKLCIDLLETERAEDLPCTTIWVLLLVCVKCIDVSCLVAEQLWYFAHISPHHV